MEKLLMNKTIRTNKQKIRVRDLIRLLSKINPNALLCERVVTKELRIGSSRPIEGIMLEEGNRVRLIPTPKTPHAFKTRKIATVCYIMMNGFRIV